MIIANARAETEKKTGVEKGEEKKERHASGLRMRTLSAL